MIVQVHCQRCTKHESIETDLELERPEVKSPLGIPMPNASNGLTTYSLVHNDHTLILDIDYNGDVRSERIIDRLNLDVESIVATISTKLIDTILSTSTETSIFFIIENKNVHRLLLGVFQNLIYNLVDESAGTMSFDHNRCIFELDNMIVYVGGWDKKNDKLARENGTIVYELTASNLSLLLDRSHKDLNINAHTNYVLFYNMEEIIANNLKRDLFELSSHIPNLTMLDIGTLKNSAFALYNLFQSIINNGLNNQ